jgi:glycerol-3-phosphate acyltransferase PlsX
MRIGIDIMGGDYSPGAAIEGSLLAREELSSDVEMILIGDRERIEPYATEKAHDLSSFEIIHTAEWLRMGDHPLKSLKRTPGASIFLGQRLLKNKELDGFCSAGNTGAMLVGALVACMPDLSTKFPNHGLHCSISVKKKRRATWLPEAPIN